MVAEQAVDQSLSQEQKSNDKKEKRTTYCWGLLKKKTLISIWGTIIVTLTNFGYFTGGYYAFNHFQAQHFCRLS